MADDSTSALPFNGIDATSGGYLFPSINEKALAEIASGRVPEGKDEEAHLAELEQRVRESKNKPHLGVKAGIDPADLSQAGWGVIFPAAKVGSEQAQRHAAIRKALAPLLELRRAQASAVDESFYQEFSGPRGYRPNTSKQKYLGDLGVGAGPADPLQGVPYYLLLVGSPEEIPFHIQYQIDVQYAVGRLHFDTIDEYERYARSVVEAETQGVAVPRRLAMVGVANPDDPATQLSRAHLVEPLAERARGWDDTPGWTVDTVVDDRARKAPVRALLGGAQTPGLLFTASHGMGFPLGHERQREHQGALLMQDWDGPDSGKGPIDPSLYLSADDIADDAKLLGLIAFNFACYGGGTPRYDEFSKQAFKQREAIAEQPFVSRLHQRMLGHPRGGALAAIGHIERAWACSFMWGAGRKGQRTQLAVFESTLRTLMKGGTVGMASEYLNQRYAELASDLSGALEQLEWNPSAVDDYTLADMWTSSNDARGYAIVGDPAVRLPLSSEGAKEPAERASIEVTLRSSTDGEPAGTAAAEPDHAAATTDTPALGDDDSAPTSMGESDVLAQLRAHLGRDLEIRTYVSDDVEAIAAGKPLSEHAELWALTRVSPSGDLDVVLPRSGEQEHSVRWTRHVSMVEQALRGRAQLVQALAQSTSSASPSDEDESSDDPEA